MIQEYSVFIREIKQKILISRYTAAKLANREQLLLYLNIGKMIVTETEQAAWGSKILDKISADLQMEIPGLRGFSAENLKKMRIFYHEWQAFFNDRTNETIQLHSIDIKEVTFSSTLLNQITSVNDIQIGSALLNEFKDRFFSLGFSLHYLILSKTKIKEERIFYIAEAAHNFWSFRVLEKHLNEKLFEQRGKLPNNFSKTLPEITSNKAVRMFKDEYLWDFINAEDEDNEREVETKIVENIKKFIMSLGGDFAFMGNQYRIVVDNEELFIDLLFYQRKLQCLVAFELKTGKFKAEFVGKMNLYLSVLDEYVRQPNENPSIGIILCKSKNDNIVEFAFRDFNKPMGVATYKTSNEIPSKYKNALPDIEKLKEIM